MVQAALIRGVATLYELDKLDNIAQAALVSGGAVTPTAPDQHLSTMKIALVRGVVTPGWLNQLHCMVQTAMVQDVVTAGD